MANSRREKIDIPFAADDDLVAMVAAFEACVWPYPRWTHRAHLGVAVCYLRRYPFEAALDRVRRHIPLYNRTCGDPEGYHETVTVLFVRRVSRYLRDHPEATSTAAVEELPGRATCTGPSGTTARLWSAEAKAGWVEPDLRPLDF